MFCKRDVLKNFAKFTVKHLCQCLFFNKVTKQPPELFCKKVFLKISQNSQENTCLRPATLLKKRHRCFLMNFAKFLRTPFYRTGLVAASICFYFVESLFCFWHQSEEYSEPWETSNIKRFAEMVNSFYPLTIFAKSSTFCHKKKHQENIMTRLKTQLF